VVLVELLVLLLAEGQQFLGLLNVIGDVHIFHRIISLGLDDITDVLLDLILVLHALVHIARSQGHGLSDLNNLEADTLLPLFEELLVLLIFVENGGREFETPERNMGDLHCLIGIGAPIVDNSILIVD